MTHEYRRDVLMTILGLGGESIKTAMILNFMSKGLIDVGGSRLLRCQHVCLWKPTDLMSVALTLYSDFD